MSSSASPPPPDKAETIEGKRKRCEWEEQKIVFHANWKSMVEKAQEKRLQARKVTVEEAARIREEEDAKGLAYEDRVTMKIYMNDQSTVYIGEPPAKRGDYEEKKRQDEIGMQNLKRLQDNPPVCLTWSQMQEYTRRLRKSGGFDVGDVPCNARASGLPVRPVDLGKFSERVLMENCSSLAIDEFNKRKKTKYQFEKVLKANGGMSPFRDRCCILYITFQVTDIACPGSSPLNFRAKVCERLPSKKEEVCERKDDLKVISCVPEP